VLIVTAAIGIGAAISSTGRSTYLAELAAAGPIIAVSVIVAANILLTELTTNVAAVALMVPIALDLASLTGADPRGLVLAVRVAASASFLTPLGDQTNIIVYGAGGYRSRTSGGSDCWSRSQRSSCSSR
jgi:di/tricarboxylate transporter